MNRRQSCLFVMGLLLSLPLGAVNLIFKNPATNANQFIYGQDFHLEAEALNSGDWFVLCQEDERASLQLGSIATEPLRPEMDDAQRVASKLCAQGQPVFYFSPSCQQQFSVGEVPLAELEVVQSEADVAAEAFGSPGSGLGYLNKQVHINFKQQSLSVYAVPFISGFAVLMKDLSKDEAVEPLVLNKTEYHDEGSWQIEWAGDLNRDGYVDLVFQFSRKYSMSQHHLVLSGAEGELAHFASSTFYAC